jgi:hypothetical protein
MSQKGKKQKTSHIKRTVYDEKVEFDFQAAIFAKLYLFCLKVLLIIMFLFYIYIDEDLEKVQ